jgi:hypothetical protein
MDFWKLIDDLEEPQNEHYQNTLRTLLTSTNTPLRKLLNARTEALSRSKPTTEYGLIAFTVILIGGFSFQMDYFGSHFETPLALALVVTAEILILGALAWKFLPKRQERIKNGLAKWDRRLVTIDRLLKPMFKSLDNLGEILDIFDESRITDPDETPSQIQTRTRTAIVKMLRRISPVLAPQFNPLRRNTLYRFLNDENEQTVIDALSAIAVVGDNRAIEKVLMLANGSSLYEGEERIRKVAQECLVALTARLEKENLAKSLLRSSAQPDDSPVLLRPAGNELSNPDLLLRVTTED